MSEGHFNAFSDIIYLHMGFINDTIRNGMINDKIGLS